MEVRFSLDREDFWQFTRYAYFHVPKIRSQVYGLIVMAPILSVSLLWLILKDSRLALVIGLPLGAATLAFTYLRTKRHVESYPTGKGILGEHTITIMPDGLHEQTAVCDSLQRWEGVQHIAENSRYIFLFIDTHMAHVIPKRAFPSDAAWQAFLAQAREYWREGKEP